MQPPLIAERYLIQESQTQGIWRQHFPAGFASYAQRGHSKGMPWWSWPSRLRKNARPHVWLVLLALQGCSGKGAYWQVPPMPKASLENILATHPLELVHLDYLCQGTWERPRRECSSGNRPLYPVCQSLCHVIPDCPDKCQSSGTISLSTMGYLKSSSWIRVGTSRVIWWLISESW